MKTLAAIACSSLCIASTAALDYGSTSLYHPANPDKQVEHYAQELCAQSAGQPRVITWQGARLDYTHIVCTTDSGATGDIFARYADGRLDINYRLK